MFSIYEDSKIKEAWRLFATKGMLRREVLKPEIAYSWARCQLLGLQTGRIKDIPVSPEEYHLARNDAQHLIQNAAPYFENFMAVSGYDSVNLALTDNRGLVLVDWIQKSDCFAYRQGVSVLEERLGTNGAALSILQKKPVCVQGAEHFLEALHSVQTLGIPLYNADHKLTAVIAATASFETDEIELLERLEHLGSMVSGSLQIHNTHQAVIQLKDHYAAALDALPESILCFDRYGQILHGNSSAERLFAHKILDLRKFNIRELVRMDQPIRLEALLNGKCRDRLLEGYYDSQDGLMPAVMECVSFNETGGVKMGMIKLSPLPRYREQVNRWFGRRHSYGLEDLVGRSAGIMEIRRLVRSLAENSYPCLLTGESGTGKKVIAHVLHGISGRGDGPLYYVNCNSVPKREIDSELFGHVAGAAGDEDAGCMGAIEMADGGTLYLDNVGELSLATQTKLLKYLDCGEFVKNGSEHIRKTSVRIVAGTKQDLTVQISRGLFRPELLNRLTCHRIDTIPLRHRKEDIPLLTDYLIREAIYPRPFETVRIDPAFYECLNGYDWPGNIRELQKVVQLALYRAKEGEALGPHLISGLDADAFKSNQSERSLNLELLEREAILKAIDMAGENLSQAAKLLGIGRSTLYRKLERYEIPMHQNESEKSPPNPE